LLVVIEETRGISRDAVFQSEISNQQFEFQK